MFFRKGIEFDPFLHRIHKGSLDFVEHDNSERKGCNKDDEYGRKQQINVGVYGSAGKDKVISKDNQE